MESKPTSSKKAFTLIELLAGIAIIAALVAFGVVYVAGYISDSQRIADQRTLKVLNEALTRYKCEGGDVNALTNGAPMSRVIARLQQPITWAGMTHSVLQAGKTYLGRSIYALGDKKQYRFTQFNTFTGEQGGRSPVDLNAAAGGLVGWWKFDEGSGTSAEDSSGSGNAGTISSTSRVAGIKGNALNFSGGSVSIDNIAVNTNAGAKNTVAFWMKWDGSGGTQIPFYFRSGYDLAFLGGFGFNTLRSDCLGISTSGLANQWVHVVAIFYNGTPSASDNTLYINGIQKTFTVSSTPNDRSVNSSIYVGGGTSWPFYGVIDDVRIYNRALTAAEVQDLYNQ